MTDDTSSAFLRRPKKLVVCCDGTWMDSDSGWVKDGPRAGTGHLQTPSNVTRISRAIKTEDRNSVPQIVYYQAGVGTGMGIRDRLLGGGTGLGLSEHIREAYSFLANNYETGDNIFLCGFSRGAFTARSLASLIGQLGLLNKRGLAYFSAIFADFENAGNSDWQGSAFLSEYRDELTGKSYQVRTSPDKPVDYLREYRAVLQSLGLTHKGLQRDSPTQDVLIRAIACWDTVGALGIPTFSWLQRLFGLPPFLRNYQKYRFMDTNLTDNICNAFQALALDEHRAPFTPALWEKPDGCDTNLKQVWFCGAHSGVGGSYYDTETADITLAWMMDQLSGQHSPQPWNSDEWIEFDEDYLTYPRNLDLRLGNEDRPAHTWGCGPIFKSLQWPQSIAGQRTRTPGRYRKTDRLTGKFLEDILLRNTHEAIHCSVRARLDLGGFGPIDNPREQSLFARLMNELHRILGRNGHEVYRPAALQGWVLNDGHERHDEMAVNNVNLLRLKEGQRPVWVWEGKDAHMPSGTTMPEDKLGKFEVQLLRRVQQMREDVGPANARILGAEEVGDLVVATNQGVESIESIKELRRLQQSNGERAATLP